MIRPDLPLETEAPHQEHQHQEHQHSLHPNTPTCSSEETIEEDDCHYEYVHVGVGHSRIARTLLDGHIPTKRPRLLSSSSLETPPHEHSGPRVFVFEVPVVPQASQPADHGPSLQAGRPSLLTEHCLDDSNSHTYNNDSSSHSHSHNNDDGNSSCGWSLQPLAPNTSTATTPTTTTPLSNAMILTHNNSNNASSINNGIAMDRWRSHPTISSFSSTITERSTGMDDSSSSYNNNTTTTPPLFEQQPQQHPESSNASATTTTTNTTSSSSRRKSRHPQKHNSTGNSNVAVEHLTTRLDHCCNITTTNTSMRALKRRNNIYTPDTQSTLYNPQQDYDYSHAKLARRLRKKNCQQANKEVLRVMTGRLNTNINYNNNQNCDENTSPMASSSSPSTTTSSSSSSNHSTPTMSNTATTTAGGSFFGSTTPDKHLPTFHNNSKEANDDGSPTATTLSSSPATTAMDVIMGESC